MRMCSVCGQCVLHVAVILSVLITVYTFFCQLAFIIVWISLWNIAVEQTKGPTMANPSTAVKQRVSNEMNTKENGISLFNAMFL